MKQNFKFNGCNVTVYNFQEAQVLLRKLNGEKQKYEELSSYTDLPKSTRRDFLNKLVEVKKEIDKLNKFINRINDYRNIKVNITGDYDVTKTEITFPKDWTNTKIISWLDSNEYPTQSERISTGCGRDCTGRVYYIRFELKNQKATISEYRDV